MELWVISMNIIFAGPWPGKRLLCLCSSRFMGRLNKIKVAIISLISLSHSSWVVLSSAVIQLPVDGGGWWNFNVECKYSHLNSAWTHATLLYVFTHIWYSSSVRAKINMPITMYFPTLCSHHISLRYSTSRLQSSSAVCLAYANPHYVDQIYQPVASLNSHLHFSSNQEYYRPLPGVIH